MKRAALGLCLATAFAASLAAQAGTPQTPAPTPAPQSATPQTPTAAPTPAAGDITITGCLAKGADGTFTLNNVQQDASATGTSGATATTPGATSTPGATAPGATAGAGAAGASAAAAAQSTWMLKGGADLANHVGHRISVTGKRAMAASSAPAATSGAAGATSPAGTSGSASANMSNARTLEVASVKMVAASCQ